MRTSCDRCRTQKLKCSVSEETAPAGTQRCERCVRAKAHCVFTRRARGRRATSTARRHVQTHSAGSSLAKPSPGHGLGGGRMRPRDLNARILPSPDDALASPLITESSMEDTADEYFSYMDTLEVMAGSGAVQDEIRHDWRGGKVSQSAFIRQEEH